MSATFFVPVKSKASSTLEDSELAAILQLLEAIEGLEAKAGKSLEAKFQEDLQQASQNSIVEEKESESAKRLKDAAAQFGYSCEDMPRDGNCFFHAVAHQLKDKPVLKEYTHANLRERANTDIKKNPALYKDKILDYKAFLEGSGVGKDADSLQIVALSRALGITIVLIQNHNPDHPVIFKPAHPTATVYIGYQYGIHYQSLLPALGEAAAARRKRLQEKVEAHQALSLEEKAVTPSIPQKTTAPAASSSLRAVDDSALFFSTEKEQKKRLPPKFSPHTGPLRAPQKGIMPTLEKKIDYSLSPLAVQRIMGEPPTLLEHGGFGSVFLGHWEEEEVVIKRINVKEATAQTKQTIYEEAIAMAEAATSNYLVRLKKVCFTEDYYYLVMEYMRGGNLRKFLEKYPALPWSTRYRIACDISIGLYHLHKAGIFHCDIKSLNVLLDEAHRAKLADFGIAKLKGITLQTTVKDASYPYIDPILLGEDGWLKEGVDATAEMDIYSLGMVFWELATGKRPFESGGNPQQGETIPTGCPTEFKAVIESCWAKDPTARPTAKKLVKALKGLWEKEKAQEALTLPITSIAETKTVAEDKGWVLPVTGALQKWPVSYRKLKGSEATSWHSAVVAIQRQARAVREGTLAFTAFQTQCLTHLQQEGGCTWPVFWAITFAVAELATAPELPYSTRSLARGSWFLPAAEQARFADLAALVCYWSHQPVYAAPEYQSALATVFQAWLVGDPHSGLPTLTPEFKRRVAYAWHSLPFNNDKPAQTPPVLSEASALITAAQAAIQKKASEHQAALQSLQLEQKHLEMPFIDTSMPSASQRDAVHTVVTLQSQVALSTVFPLHRALVSRAAASFTTEATAQQEAFYHAAAQPYLAVLHKKLEYTAVEAVLYYTYHAWQAHPSKESEMLLMQRLLLSLRQAHTLLLHFQVQADPPFAKNPLKEKKETGVPLGTVSTSSPKPTPLEEQLCIYQTLLAHLQCLSADLGAYGVATEVASLYAPLAPYQKAYRASYVDYRTSREKESLSPLDQRHQQVKVGCARDGQQPFFEQSDIDAKREALPLPSVSAWRQYHTALYSPPSTLEPTEEEKEKKEKAPSPPKSTASWFATVADWLNERLPPPPCAFSPFVVPVFPGSAARTYRLGIEMADTFYREHPFFSHWAALYCLCVELFSGYSCALETEAVSAFCEADFLPYLIASRAELQAFDRHLVYCFKEPAAAKAAMATAGPLVRVYGDGPPLPLHPRLEEDAKATVLTGIEEKKAVIKDTRRPHAVALEAHWQHTLWALTVPKPTVPATEKESKTVPAELVWQDNQGRVHQRFLSSPLVKRLFDDHGQLAAQHRALLSGTRDTWRITVADCTVPDPTLPLEAASGHVIAYLKTFPHDPWRQAQTHALASRITDYGNTGSFAYLRCQGKTWPVWLSSPAGRTFCMPTELPRERRLIASSASLGELQVLNRDTSAELQKYVSGLDPYYFTQAVFLTWLLVHEDDQLRNLGFEAFSTPQGKTAYRVISFDTDTTLGPAWVRKADGRIAVKLKSFLYCTDAMRLPLDPQAVQAFLAVKDPRVLLQDWLLAIDRYDRMAAHAARKSIVKTPPCRPSSHLDNQLPPAIASVLYHRWQRLQFILSLPQHSGDSGQAAFPVDHLSWLQAVDPVLGSCYAAAHDTAKVPWVRFEHINQDYQVQGGVKMSVTSGALRSLTSLAQGPRPSLAVSSAAGVQSPREVKQALEEQLRWVDNQALWVTYLEEQAKLDKVDAVFREQMDRLVKHADSLGNAIEAEEKKLAECGSQLDRLHTQAVEWAALAQSDTGVALRSAVTTQPSASIEEESKTLLPPPSAAVPQIVLYPPNAQDDRWQVEAYNGRRWVVDKQPLNQEPAVGEIDLRPLLKKLPAVGATPSQVASIQQAARAFFADHHYKQEAAIERLKAEQKACQAERNRLLAALQRQTKITAADARRVRLEKDDPHFLMPLFQVELRQLVVRRLVWSRFPSGKGREQVLRLLKLGGWHELNVEGCTELTDADVETIAQASPDLRVLNLSGCLQLTHQAVFSLAKYCPYLQRLSVRKLPQLKTLWQGWRGWSRAQPLLFPRLTHLDMSNCNGLVQLKLRAPQLQYLKMAQCKHSLEAKAEWVVEAPLLQQLDVHNCPHLSRLQVDSTALRSLDAHGSDAMFLDWVEVLHVYFEKESGFAPDSTGSIRKQLGEEKRASGDKEEKKAAMPLTDPTQPQAELAYSRERDQKVGREIASQNPGRLFLLKWVAEGEQTKAERILKKMPHLALERGALRDLSGRHFENITAFQYALWALDWHMWKMLLKYMRKEEAALQLAELEEKGTAHGKHFSLEPLIEALDTYVKNYDSWTSDQCEQHWCKQVGGAQLGLAAHVVNEYCHPTRSFDPCPTFDEAELPRSRQTAFGEWFTDTYNGGRLGESVAVSRGRFGRPIYFRVIFDKYYYAAYWDVQAAQSLSKMRLLQLDQLKAELRHYATSKPGGERRPL